MSRALPIDQPVRWYDTDGSCRGLFKDTIHVFAWSEFGKNVKETYILFMTLFSETTPVQKTLDDSEAAWTFHNHTPYEGHKSRFKAKIPNKWDIHREWKDLLHFRACILQTRLSLVYVPVQKVPTSTYYRTQLYQLQHYTATINSVLF
jgi:hypothetical protein